MPQAMLLRRSDHRVARSRVGRLMHSLRWRESSGVMTTTAAQDAVAKYESVTYAGVMTCLSGLVGAVVVSSLVL